MKTNEAIVLAGGLGTRLKEVLPDIPKCMAPVNGKPFLTYVLAYLEGQGINKVILSVGYLKEHIINYFGNRYNTISIEYSIENEPLGTGGAIKLAIGYSLLDHVFILNGDTYFTANLALMEQLHYQSSSDITIAAKQVTNASRYGLIETTHADRISAFKEKEQISGGGWINGGIYLVKKQVLNQIGKTKFSLENDLFKVSCSSLKLQAFKSTDFFLDMGVPDDYLLAQTLFLKSKDNEK